MRFLWGSKDGGPESRVRMWGFEAKGLFSVLLLRFEEGTREAFHTHAFNSVSWVLAGTLVEQTLAQKGEAWNPTRTTWAGFGPSWRAVHTDRRRFHRVAGGRLGAWVLTLRGPWWDGWREYDPVTGEQTKLTHGRRVRAPLAEEVPELSQTGSYPLMSVVCATCRRKPSVAVACVPGMPVSEAYCEACLQGNAIPWDLAVLNTAAIGGLEHAAEWWREIVVATCELNKKTLNHFCNEVEQCLTDMDSEAGESSQSQPPTDSPSAE